MQTRQHIFLIGFMGCGKTYWGQILAKKLGLPFHDLDDLIATRSGKCIAEIFTEDGEPGFRQLEHDTLQTLADLPPSVIATGGGTPCFFDNMEWMNACGTTIYLSTPSTLLAERLRHEKEIRPLLHLVNNVDLQRFIENKVKERAPCYLKAKIILEQIEPLSQFFDQMCKRISEV